MTAWQQLPSMGQMQHKASRMTLELAVSTHSGAVSIKCNCSQLMQSIIGQANRPEVTQPPSVQESRAIYTPSVLACLLSIGGEALSASTMPAALGAVDVSQHDQSGYAMHPAVLESPVALTALTATWTDSAPPNRVKSVAATVISPTAAPPSDLTVTAATDGQSDDLSAVVACHPGLSQQQVIFSDGPASSAALSAAPPAAATAAATAAMTAEAVSDDQQESDEGALVAADNVLLQMHGAQRKLHIQAQVGVNHLCCMLDVCMHKA